MKDKTLIFSTFSIFFTCLNTLYDSFEKDGKIRALALALSVEIDKMYYFIIKGA